MGSVGANKGKGTTVNREREQERDDVFIQNGQGGKTYYTIIKKGKSNSLYLHSDYKGTNVNLVDDYKIIKAKDPEQAYIKVPYVGTIYFKDEKGLMKILKNALK